MTKAVDKKRFVVRLTEDELKEINEKIKETGMSNQEFGRRALLNLKVTSIKDVDALAEQIRHIGVNINQAVHKANTNDYITKTEIQNLIEKLVEIWQLLSNYL